MKGLICAGWADENRRGIPRAQDLSAGINVGHVNEAARAQLEFLETFPIGTQGHFIVDAGRHVAEVRRRYVFRMSGSKSNTSIASFGLATAFSRSRGAQMIG